MKNAVTVSKMPANNTMLQIQRISASGKKCKKNIMQVFIVPAGVSSPLDSVPHAKYCGKY